MVSGSHGASSKNGFDLLMCVWNMFFIDLLCVLGFDDLPNQWPEFKCFQINGNGVACVHGPLGDFLTQQLLHSSCIDVLRV